LTGEGLKITQESGEELDAEFEVEESLYGEPGFDILLRSRSGGRNSPNRRNPDYFEALEVILRRLAAADATILNIEVDSTVTRSLSPTERRLGLEFPLDLAESGDLGQLRKRITSAQSTIGRRPDVKPSGGNITKQIRMTIAASRLLANAEAGREWLQAPRIRKTWIFQWNPKVWGGDEFLHDKSPGDSSDWSVNQYRAEVAAGDRMLFWRAGKDSGIYAIATIVGRLFERAPEDRVNPNAQSEWAVDFRFDELLDPPVLKTELLAHPTLKGLRVIRFPNATNFPVDSDQWEALEQLLRKTRQRLADEVTSSSGHPEGAVKKVSVDARERSGRARADCIEYYGTTCVVCDLSFGEVYGDIGEGFIHVHHLVDLALVSGTTETDGIRDLRPVCPNCHAMLHTATPAHGVDWLRDRLAGVTSS